MKKKIQGPPAAVTKMLDPDPQFRIRSMYKDGHTYICTQDFIAWMAMLFLKPPTPAELAAGPAAPPPAPPAPAPAAGREGEPATPEKVKNG